MHTLLRAKHKYESKLFNIRTVFCTDTVLVFTSSELHILTSQKKGKKRAYHLAYFMVWATNYNSVSLLSAASLLQPLSSAAEAQGVKLTLHVKGKQEDGSVQVQELVDAINAAEAAPVVGNLPKDKHEGKFIELYNNLFSNSGLQTVDVSGGIADVLASKEASEILNVKKAAMLASKAMKDFVVGKIESIVDEGKSVKHSKLSELTEEVITDPSKLGVKLKPENVDIAYPPIVQSGGKYDLKVSAPSDDSPLHDGVIVVSIGTRYSSYCANAGRTYFINPTKQQVGWGWYMHG